MDGAMLLSVSPAATRCTVDRESADAGVIPRLALENTGCCCIAVASIMLLNISLLSFLTGRAGFG
jgi:hypothetical protein